MSTITLSAARWFWRALAMLTLSWVGILHGQDVTPSPEAQYEGIDCEYKAKLDDCFARYEQVSTDEERRKIYAAYYPNRDEYAARCMALAKQYPGTTGAVRALVFVLHGFRTNDVTREALNLLRTDYLDREELALPCAWYGNAGFLIAQDFLRDLAARSPHRAVRGTATLSLARLAARNESPDAEKLLTQAAADYGDVHLWDRTVKEVADGELLRLRTIAVGKPAPEIEGVDIDGAAMKLSDFRGKVVLLDFWGYW